MLKEDPIFEPKFGFQPVQNIKKFNKKEVIAEQRKALVKYVTWVIFD